MSPPPTPQSNFQVALPPCGDTWVCQVVVAVKEIAEATTLHSQKEIKADRKPGSPVRGAFRQSGKKIDTQKVPPFPPHPTDCWPEGGGGGGGLGGRVLGGAKGVVRDRLFLGGGGQGGAIWGELLAGGPLGVRGGGGAS